MVLQDILVGNLLSVLVQVKLRGRFAQSLQKLRKPEQLVTSAPAAAKIRAEVAHLASPVRAAAFLGGHFHSARTYVTRSTLHQKRTGGFSGGA